MKNISLLISARKSSVTVFTPRCTPTKIHSNILIEASRLRLVKCTRIFGVFLDLSLSINKHSHCVAERVSIRNSILKTFAGTSWGHQKETLLMTCKAVGRLIINYAASVWSPNLHDTNITERRSEDRHWLSQDVQYRSPTHRSRDSEI